MIEKLREKIIEANSKYRLGEPIMSDAKYDQLLDELALLSPDDDIFTKIGHVIVDETRKSRLPIEMASMTKTKSIDDIDDWCRLKGISKKEVVIITPKFDGLSLCVDERSGDCWTRGDGEFGQKSNEHYKLIQNKLSKFILVKKIDGKFKEYTPSKFFTYGEVMISKSTFTSKYSNDFANPRNLVGGLLNSKDATQPLKDCNFIKYGIYTDNDVFQTKQELIDFLNENQSIGVPYHICKISDLTEELLISLFHKWCIDYEIDGVIIEIDDLGRQKELGRENSSNNPIWARAFKHPSFEQCAETEVIGISWNISKQGYLKPTLHLNPIKLDGVTVSNVTGNNARFVKDMGLGVGAIVLVKRSGMVIPLIVDVLKSVDFVMPNVPNIDWNDNGVELMTLTKTDEQKLKQLIAFFGILEVKNVSEGIIKQFWDAGYQSVKDILNLTPNDMEKLDRFGKRKATIVYTAIQSSIKSVSLSKLQHATGMFKGLGSKKLVLLEQFTKKPSIEEVMSIEGFAGISAESYINNYDEFFEFIKDLPINIEKKVTVALSDDDMVGNNFVFTGVRRPDLESEIESRGGKIGGTVSKNTTHLVMKAVGSGSSKELKAVELGIKILTVGELETMLNG